MGRVKNKNLKDMFYIDLRVNPEYGRFLTVYDIDIVDKHPYFKKINKSSTGRVVNLDELIEILKEAVSIIFYGEKSINIGIKHRYIHPEAVGSQMGVKTAIYIRT